ncbi:MAG: GNAT family N-acetyltransferase [Clostridia bacterium]|nr:GNAT family N-acetyltransferase [Clostridia bacterium]
MKVEQITYEKAKPFILGVHYARRMPCIQYAYGLYIEDKLIGVISYGQPASPSLCRGVAGEENKKNVLELNRLVILPEYNGKNYASILISKSLKMLPPHRIVVSYADVGGWGHYGYVYQATNFLYTGTTKPRTDKYGGENGHSRHYSKDETRRQIRTAKHRYITFTGTKKDKKELLRELKYPIIKEYPKGDNVKYNTFNPIPINENLGKAI